MRATFVLGRIAGVRVGVHWSVLGIFAIVAFGLAQGRLPVAHPGRSWGVYWAAGLSTAVVFFASLLAHEVAHAVVARRNGVEVDDIVLWLLGGVARLRTEASTPGAELRIAGVGPLVSLLLGGFFALAAWLLDLASVSVIVVEMAAWLAGINVLLAVFNAVPAAPLDGGRLLRAFLWWRTGDRLRATAGATAAGKGFGWLLVTFGLIVFMARGVFGGLWLALIGWFLIATATAEGRQAQLRGLLAGVPVRDVMTPDPLTVSADTTVADFLADAHYRYRHSAFPVTDGEAPVGLVTLDEARRVAQAGAAAVPVREVMVPLSRTVVTGPDSALADLLPRMERGAENRVLVVADGRLVGIVSLSDVSRTVNWLMNAPGRGGGR
ncbi:site-2 protease family protein [Streptomyces sp. NPDC020996]|uniref:site-2 protease family protein n=1 Tax=Streptomyces sp. NPDC020996 TaxID=3154791 RepID=UPI0033C12154